MANEDHVALLRQGAEPWNACRRTASAVTPDLSASDLSAAQLSMTSLSKADLREANLS